MGSLSGSTAVSTAGVNLSSPVQTDWIQFPASTTPNRKSGGGSTITVPTTLGANVGIFGYSGDAVGITWTGGTPTASGTASTNGIYAVSTSASITGNGMQFTVPADTTTRTLVIAWGSFQSACKMVATLSDGSATAVTHTPTGPAGSGSSDYLTTLTYSANSASQTLTIALTLNESTYSGGNVTLLAAKYLNASAALTGTAASTQAANTSSASGAASVAGASASSQALNVSAASGRIAVSGTSASIQGAATSAASGVVMVGGVGSSTQAANSDSASGLVLASGSGASTQQANVSTASGAIRVSASAASSQAPNASNAAGAIGNVVQGSAASTQAPNVSAASGATSAAGSSASTQASNVSLTFGSVGVKGSASSVQAANSASAAGSVLSSIVGSAASTQQPQTSSATGRIGLLSVNPITFVVRPEARKYTVATENRAHSVLPENRTVKVAA